MRNLFYTLPIYFAMAVLFIAIPYIDAVGQPGVEQSIAPHIEEFTRIAKLKLGPDVDIPPIDGSLIDLTNSFMSKMVGGNVIGVCRPRFDGLPYRIDLDVDWWNKNSYLAREALVFHELGHCILHKKHNDKLFGGKYSKPVSMMNSELLYDYEYKSTRDYYINELFSGVDKDSIGNRFSFLMRPKLKLSSPVPLLPQPDSMVRPLLLLEFPAPLLPLSE